MNNYEIKVYYKAKYGEQESLDLPIHTPQQMMDELQFFLSENYALRKDCQLYSDEKEAAIKAFVDIRKIFQGRKWITEGRGTYPYNDDRYKEEVRYILDEFNEINSNFWKEIKTKTFEYRQKIESPLLNKIEELEGKIDKLEGDCKYWEGRYNDVKDLL